FARLGAAPRERRVQGIGQARKRRREQGDPDHRVTRRNVDRDRRSALESSAPNRYEHGQRRCRKCSCCHAAVERCGNRARTCQKLAQGRQGFQGGETRSSHQACGKKGQIGLEPRRPPEWHVSASATSRRRIVPSKRKVPRRRIALALAGGGPLGGIYEVGVLIALAECLEGVDLNKLDVYVGVSSGGLVAAALANGVSPAE